MHLTKKTEIKKKSQQFAILLLKIGPQRSSWECDLSDMKASPASLRGWRNLRRRSCGKAAFQPNVKWWATGGRANGTENAVLILISAHVGKKTGKQHRTENVKGERGILVEERSLLENFSFRGVVLGVT